MHVLLNMGCFYSIRIGGRNAIQVMKINYLYASVVEML